MAVSASSDKIATQSGEAIIQMFMDEDAYEHHIHVEGRPKVLTT